MSDHDERFARGDAAEAPARLVDLADDGAAIDPELKRAGAWMSRVAPPPPFTADRLWRVRSRLAETTRAATPRRRGARVMGWVVAGLLLLVSSGVVTAARGWLPPALEAVLPEAMVARLQQKRVRRTPRPMTSPSAAPSGSLAASLPPPAATVQTPPGAADATSEPSLSPPSLGVPPAPAIAVAPAARPRRALTGATPTLTTERALLEQAVVQLRQRRDAGETLRLLDEHDARFSTSVLAEESARLRIDALLLAQQRDRALEQLNTLALSDGARDAELRLIRGELRAGAGDCAGAVADFDRVLASGGDRALSLHQRAEAGRTVCTGSSAARPIP